MRRWTTALLPASLGAAWLVCLFGPLLSPERALANRDVPIFHLPLRGAFKDLAAFGLPQWNPWLHGGQPILSNPSYGAFYPPSWLIFALPPAYALGLMAVLHGAIAFVGAWRLARHFGCGRDAAALAAVGYTGCGVYLSLLSAYTLFGSMAWFPWVVAWGDAALQDEAWRRPALLAGGALALQLLNGEPSTVVMSGLALLALGAVAARRRPAAAARVLVPILCALALAAVQLLPTLGRLADSPRTVIPAEMATTWSMRPARLVEVVFPHFFGDPTRDVEGLFFGRRINDEDYPYIELLYPGLLLAVLGTSALARRGIPRRAAWALAIGAGCALALGRHNPVYEALRHAIPVLAVLRYPEKFIVLAVLALAVAGVLGWQRLLDEREAGRPEAAGLPLAIALLVLATASALAAWLLWAPGAGARFIASYGSPLLPAAKRSGALDYLRGESWSAVRTAAAVTLLLALCRWRRPHRRLLEALAVLLVAADLWLYGHVLVQTFPADTYRTPPPLARAILPARDRIFLQEVTSGALGVAPSWGDPRTFYSRSHLLGLEPYSGLLWHIPYAFDPDFELMLTAWARRAEDVLQGEKPDSPALYRYLGAWNVGTFLVHKSLQEQAAALDDPAALPLRRIANAHVLPRFRFVPEVTFHRDHAAALAAARAEGWRVGRHDHWVWPAKPPQGASHFRPPELLAVRDDGGRIELRYRSAEGAFFVAAMTYDENWRARLDDNPRATYPTAACQLGVALPAGEHRLVLRYREPLLVPGAAVSFLALAGGVALLVAGRRRRMA